MLRRPLWLGVARVRFDWRPVRPPAGLPRPSREPVGIRPPGGWSIATAEMRWPSRERGTEWSDGIPLRLIPRSPGRALIFPSALTRPMRRLRKTVSCGECTETLPGLGVRWLMFEVAVSRSA
jgi:hypothetical protein